MSWPHSPELNPKFGGRVVNKSVVLSQESREHLKLSCPLLAVVLKPSACFLSILKFNVTMNHVSEALKSILSDFTAVLIFFFHSWIFRKITWHISATFFRDALRHKTPPPLFIPLNIQGLLLLSPMLFLGVSCFKEKWSRRL